MVTSGQYTHGHHDSVLRSHRWRTAENSASYLLPRITSGQSVLDIGCGPGTITADLVERVAPGQVLGIDAAAEVVEETRKLASERGLPNLEVRVADVYSLSMPDGQFDIVHAHQVMQHLSDPVAALREMRRVCRPGGLVAARDADYAAMAWYPRIPVLDEWQALYQAVARGNAAEPDAGRHLLHWAHEAGFPDVVASASVWCYSSAEEVVWWGDLWAERVSRSEFAVQALARGLADRRQLEVMAAGWREWAAHPDAWFTVLNGEIICTA